MTNTAPTATYDRPEIVAEAAVAKGYSIVILTWPNYRTGEACFSVARANRRHFVRLSNHGSEAAARKAANAEWRQCRRAMMAA